VILDYVFLVFGNDIWGFRVPAETLQKEKKQPEIWIIQGLGILCKGKNFLAEDNGMV
jgi:hypothetical protein